MAAVPVAASRLLQAEPSAETSMRYPVMGDQPSLAGALHDRSICVCPFAVAVNPLGVPGNVAGMVSFTNCDKPSMVMVPRPPVAS